MVLSVSALTRDISHTLHGASVEGSTALDYINQASHHLANFTEWSWLIQRSVVLPLRGTITFSDGTWDESSLQLTSVGAFADYTWVQGDELKTLDGTSVILGRFQVRARVDDDTIELKTSLSSTAADLLLGDIEILLELPTVPLPLDFGTIVSLDGMNGLTISVHQGTHADLVRMRTNEIQVTSVYFTAAVTYAASDAAIDGIPVPLLELWPPPGVNVLDGFVLFYTRDLLERNEDNQIVAIPPFMEMCFRELVRAIARGYEHEQSGPGLAQELALWEQHPATIRAMERDGMQQQHYGPLRGGSVQSWGHYQSTRRPFLSTGPILGP